MNTPTADRPLNDVVESAPPRGLTDGPYVGYAVAVLAMVLMFIA